MCHLGGATGCFSGRLRRTALGLGCSTHSRGAPQLLRLQRAVGGLALSLRQGHPLRLSTSKVDALLRDAAAVAAHADREHIARTAAVRERRHLNCCIQPDSNPDPGPNSNQVQEGGHLVVRAWLGRGAAVHLPAQHQAARLVGQQGRRRRRRRDPCGVPLAGRGREHLVDARTIDGDAELEHGDLQGESSRAALATSHLRCQRPSEHCRGRAAALSQQGHLCGPQRR
eukprot:scaffold31862_cov63-Phaeocystis_antarctica.AAC.9